MKGHPIRALVIVAAVTLAVPSTRHAVLDLRWRLVGVAFGVGVALLWCVDPRRR